MSHRRGWLGGLAVVALVAGCGSAVGAHDPAGAGGPGWPLTSARTPCAAAATSLSGAGTGNRTDATAGHWGDPVALVAPGIATGSLGVAATADGSLLAGWIQGPPPKIYMGLGPPAKQVKPQRPLRQEVMLDFGSFAKGFGEPVRQSVGASGSIRDLYVTLSETGVGYSAWQQAGALHVTVTCGRRIVVADRLLLHDADPIGLFPLAHGSAALVWGQYGHGTPLLTYGRLSASGRLVSAAVIAHPSTRDTEATELSVNSSGELIAAWVYDDLSVRPGSSPATPRYRVAGLRVAACEPAFHCGSPQTVRLGATRPDCINPAVAISSTGQATVIAAADKEEEDLGCDDPLGVWASVTPANTTRIAAMQKIRKDGDFPVAEPIGRAGTVAAYDAGPAISDSFGSLLIPPSGPASSRALMLDRGGLWNSALQSALAPVSNGWYLLAWEHDASHVEILAALGHGDHIQSPAVAIDRSPEGYVAATDGRGDAMILYSPLTRRGGWPYTSGLGTTQYTQ